MKDLLNIILVVLAMTAMPVLSNTGVDASIQKLLDEEASRYVDALASSEGEALIALAVELQDSGLTDKRVLDAAEKRAIALHQSYNADKKRKDDYKAAASLARFLAGSGTTAYFPTLDMFMRESESRSLRNLSKTVMTRTGWYMRRNEIMNNFSQHNPDNSLLVTRYLNLLNDRDRAFGRYAAESMTRQGRSDAILAERMADIVRENYRSPGFGNNLDAIAWYVRFLGRLGDEYHPLLNELANYDSLDKKLSKHVKKALKGQ